VIDVHVMCSCQQATQLSTPSQLSCEPRGLDVHVAREEKAETETPGELIVKESGLKVRSLPRPQSPSGTPEHVHTGRGDRVGAAGRHHAPTASPQTLSDTFSDTRWDDGLGAAVVLVLCRSTGRF